MSGVFTIFTQYFTFLCMCVLVQLTIFVFKCSVLCRQMLHDLYMYQSHHSTRLASIAERIVDFDDSPSMQDLGYCRQPKHSASANKTYRVYGFPFIHRVVKTYRRTFLMKL